MRGLISGLVVGTLLLIVGLRLYYGVYVRMEFGKTLPDFNGQATQPAEWGDCQALRGAVGVEDLLALDDWTILGTNLDSMGLWHMPGVDGSFADASQAEQGSIWVLRLSRDDGRVESWQPATLVGRPSALQAFHPHGFGRLGDLLVVVNHAYQRGGELLEKFRIVRSGDAVALHYLSHVNASSFAYGVLNDVVPVSEADLFVTQWLPKADPPSGRRLDAWHKLYDSMGYLTSSEKQTVFYHCHNEQCQKVAKPGKMWNGITADHANSKLYALDLLAKTVHAWRYDLPDGSGGTTACNLTELTVEAIALPQHYGDNIEFDPRSRTISTAGMALLGPCFLNYYEGLANQLPSKARGGPNSAGATCPSAVTRVSVDQPAQQQFVLHDGSQLGALSAGVFVQPAPGVEVLVAGSFCDNGVLVCRKK